MYRRTPKYCIVPYDMLYSNHYEPSHEYEYNHADSVRDLNLAEISSQGNSLELNLQRFFNGNQRNLPLEDKHRSPLEHLIDSYSHSRSRYDSVSYGSQESFCDQPESFNLQTKHHPHVSYHSQPYTSSCSSSSSYTANSAMISNAANDCFDMGSLVHPSNFEDKTAFQNNGYVGRRHSGTFPRSAPAAEQLRSQQQCEAAMLKAGFDQLAYDRLENSRRVYSRHNSESGSSLGLTDISSRLEATLTGSRDNSAWTPLGTAVGDAASKSPSPHQHLCPRDWNPIEDFNFSSDDEDDGYGQARGSALLHTGHKIPSLFTNNPCSRPFANVDMSPDRPLPSANKPAPPPPSSDSRRALASWSQIVRTTGSKPGPTVATQTVSTSPPSKSASPSPPSTRVSSPTTVGSTTTEFHRGPKIDPRWPVAQQLFLGPIPVSVTWDEIRNTFYNKVARHQILHTYVQSKPVNDVVYGQIVFDKASLAAKILKEGPIKVSGHTITVTSMKEKAKMDKRR